MEKDIHEYLKEELHKLFLKYGEIPANEEGKKLIMETLEQALKELTND